MDRLATLHPGLATSPDRRGPPETLALLATRAPREPQALKDQPVQKDQREAQEGRDRRVGKDHKASRDPEVRRAQLVSHKGSRSAWGT
jgi:hypothetical protein